VLLYPQPGETGQRYQTKHNREDVVAGRNKTATGASTARRDHQWLSGASWWSGYNIQDKDKRGQTAKAYQERPEIARAQANKASDEQNQADEQQWQANRQNADEADAEQSPGDEPVEDSKVTHRDFLRVFCFPYV